MGAENVFQMGEQPPILDTGERAGEETHGQARETTALHKQFSRDQHQQALGSQ